MVPMKKQVTTPDRPSIDFLNEIHGERLLWQDTFSMGRQVNQYVVTTQNYELVK